MFLGEVGIELGPLIAGAGIIGVALGFGSQSLVRDFLSGVFILVEDQFGAAPSSTSTTRPGTVEAVSLRTTRLRAVDGTVWHVPNGEIRRVGNMSQHWSRALLDIEVAYETVVDARPLGDQARGRRGVGGGRRVLEEPELWGVEQLGANGVMLRLVVKTTPSQQWRVSRELRERIKVAFDEEGIEIPFPQQTVWHKPAEVELRWTTPRTASPGSRCPTRPTCRRSCRACSAPRASASASSPTSSAPTRSARSGCRRGSRTSACCTRRRRG